MFEQELDVIKAAEQEAEDMVKKATAESKKLISDARTEAAKDHEFAEDDKRKIFDGFITEGSDIADRNYLNAMDDSEREKVKMTEKAHANTAEAVKMIVERIVSTSGDR